MKYKVIAYLGDPIITNGREVLCLSRQSLCDSEDHRIDVSVGDELEVNRHFLAHADIFWKYSLKEWGKINKELSNFLLYKGLNKG